MLTEEKYDVLLK